MTRKKKRNCLKEVDRIMLNAGAVLFRQSESGSRYYQLRHRTFRISDHETIAPECRNFVDILVYKHGWKAKLKDELFNTFLKG